MITKVMTEITPEPENDCFLLEERKKVAFDWPIHHHPEFELNFAENVQGCRRIVGDNIEVLGKYDLALIGSDLEHTWEQGPVQDGEHEPIREITIKFSPNLLSEDFLSHTQVLSLHRLLQEASRGVAFEMPAILHIYSRLNELLQVPPGFYRVLKLFEILYELSLCTERHTLATSSFTNTAATSDSRRVKRIEEFINANFKQEIRLQALSDLVGMTPTAFSRFFKLRTTKTVSDYIIDIRLGHATRMLVDTTMSIVEICYDSGFNNVSNFNRIFRKRKGCSPTEFRDNYHKNMQHS